MEHIRATLPTVGQVDLVFHRESKEVLDFFGKSERSRLDKVRHLGVAAAAFTGLNHTRWEYTLLQCALIQYLSVVFKNHPHISMKSGVWVDGLSSPVSSGEELLKSWALLGNVGHTQWTYGVERGLLKLAQEDAEVKTWLLKSTNLPDLRSWVEERIEAYDDSAVHYILALRRLRDGKPYDRRKTRYSHVLRNLVLPVGDLLTKDPVARSKLSRLRRLYGRLRLLSLTTLDAYNSHKPLRVALHTTINTFGQVAGFDKDSEATERMLTDVASWLADELYLHPDAAAVQLEYEQRVVRELPRRFRKTKGRPGKRRHLFANILNNGLGSPLIGKYRPLMRLTFPQESQQILGSESPFDLARRLRPKLCDPPITELSIDRNRFSGAIHLDLFLSEGADLSDQVAVWTRTAVWLLRATEAGALSTVRTVVPAPMRSRAGDLRRRLVARRFKAHEVTFHAFFHSVVGAVLPATWAAVTGPMLPSDRGSKALFLRVNIGGEVVLDEIEPHLTRCLTENPESLGADRLQEVRGLRRVLRRVQGSVVIACAEPVTLYDGFGMPKDDWDGTVVEVCERGVSLHILEAKSGKPSARRANQAFNQLAATRDIVCGPGTRYRRRRIPNVGAVLSVALGAP